MNAQQKERHRKDKENLINDLNEFIGDSAAFAQATATIVQAAFGPLQPATIEAFEVALFNYLSVPYRVQLRQLNEPEDRISEIQEELDELSRQQESIQHTVEAIAKAQNAPPEVINTMTAVSLAGIEARRRALTEELEQEMGGLDSLTVAP